MRALILALLGLSLLPAAAPAAEVPLLTVPGVRPECTAPTGFPGEIVTTVGSGGNEAEAAQFVSAAQSGLQPRQTVRFEHSVAGCAVAASRPNGSAVLAVPDDSGTIVSVRAPGGDWSAPTTFPGRGHLSTGRAAVAVSDAGDALVVWQDVAPRRRVQLHAARRIAGGTFSDPVTIAERPQEDLERASDESDWFAAGIANGGEAIVVWSDLPPERPPHRANVRVAIAPPDGGFGVPARVGEQAGHSTSSFAMTPDGSALLTIATPTRVQVLERSAGRPFGAPTTVGAGDPLGTRTVTALGAGGQAVVAWSGSGVGGVHAAIRRTDRPFSGALPTATADRRIGYDVWTATSGVRQPLRAGSWGFGGADIRATIAGDAALLAWAGPRGRHRAANLATYPLAAGNGPERSTTGGELADVRYAFPLPLADGTVALAWVDSPERLGRAHRLRLATPALADTTPIPEVRVSPPATRKVDHGDLVLPFSCGAPCEIRAQVLGRRGYEDFVRMDSAGSGRLRLTEVNAPKRLGPVRVRFTAGAADGRRSRGWTATYRLVRGAAPPLPTPIQHVRAVRRGSKVRVTIRFVRPARHAPFSIVGGFDRRGNVEPLAWNGAYGTPGEREVHTDLPADGVRWVALMRSPTSREYVRVR